MENLARAIAICGLWVLVSGGFIYRDQIAGHKILIEVGQWGWFLLPALALGLLNREMAPKVVEQAKYRASGILALFKTRSSQIFLLSCLTFIYLAGAWQRHISFHSGWDLGIYANACVGRFHSSMRMHGSILGDHFEPLLGLIVPACQVMSPVFSLLMAQALAWLIGALGVLALTSSIGWCQPVSFGCILLYLLFGGHQQIMMTDFHVYSFALATIPWLMWAVQKRSWGWFFCIAFVHGLIKESTPLFIAGIGLYLIFAGERLRGLLTFVLSVALFIVLMEWVIPYFSGGAESFYFTKLYGHLGRNLTEVVRTIFLQPQVVVSHLLDPNRMMYVVKLFVPFLFIPLLRPAIILPVLPPILISVLSNDRYMISGDFHYEAEIYPWLFCATLLLVNDATVIGMWNRVIAFAPSSVLKSLRLVWLGIFTVLFTGSSPLYYFRYFQPTRSQSELRGSLANEANKLVGCKVAVVEQIAAQVAFLPNVSLIDRFSDADAVIVAWPNGPRTWLVPYETVEEQFVPQLNRDFTVSRPLAWDQNFRIWKRPPCLN